MPHRNTRIGFAIALSLALAALCSAPTAAQEPDSTAPIEEPFVDIHGFVSQGFMLSTGNNYLAKSKRGSFEFSEVGLNVTKNLTGRLRVGMQLFARDLGPLGNYSAKFDWYYLDYRFADWLGLRAGRTKLPFGLYNEVGDIDSARVPILLPQSMYPINNRELLLAQTGLELYGYAPLGPVGNLEYRVYGGTVFADAPDPPEPIRVTELEVPYVVGGRVIWEAPLPGLRAGFSLQALRLDLGYTLAAGAPPIFMGVTNIEFSVLLWVASLEYTWRGLLIAAEYGRWRGEISSDMPAVVMPATAVNERYYLMVSYQVAPWFTPGVYYAGLYPNYEEREGRENYRHDLAATLRFDLNDHWLLKLEGHLMRGTADLDPRLNDNTPLDMLEKDWVALFIKTTAYF
jgi:hypothetical protein